MENEISPGVKVRVRVRDGAPTKQSLAPQQDPTQSQGEADCHVASLLAMTGNFESPAPISAAQNVKNGAPTKLPCHSETSSQTGRGNPFSLRRTKTTHIPKGMRIATASVRTGFAMTG